MSAALGLLRLQQVDSRIDQLENELGRIKTELENDDEAAAANGLLQAAEAARQEAEKNRSSAELEATSQRRKLQQAESSLYGGTVRNPKELQDLQADVASLKRHLSALETAELEWMERLEAAEAQCREAHAQFDLIMSRSNVDHNRLVARRTELLRLRDNLDTERAAAVSAVPEKYLNNYANLRRTRRRIAVAEISDSACAACGTLLTASLQQSARHAVELVFCPSCGRILFGG
jgi:predicted  nucleic acid-binding Zn-ribbon protein